MPKRSRSGCDIAAERVVAAIRVKGLSSMERVCAPAALADDDVDPEVLDCGVEGSPRRSSGAGGSRR